MFASIDLVGGQPADWVGRVRASVSVMFRYLRRYGGVTLPLTIGALPLGIRNRLGYWRGQRRCCYPLNARFARDGLGKRANILGCEDYPHVLLRTVFPSLPNEKAGATP